VQHIGQALRVSALIELVGDDTRALIARCYPQESQPEEAPDGEHVVRSRESAVVAAIGRRELVEEARRSDCALELVPVLGQFVAAGAPLFRVHGAAEGLDEAALHEAIVFRLEPTLDQDVGYGFRLLVDIAERSLADSPLQDPTTAVQAIDRLHDLLRQLVRRPFADGRHRDAAGVVRLVERTMSWDDYLLLATEEIRLAGAGSPPVTRRLRAMLEDLRSIAPPDRIAAVERHLDLLDASSRAAFPDERDAVIALGSDARGIGATGELAH
jgi:uncharacterized membrane protein